MKGVYKFYWDYGRSGEVSGVFIAEDYKIAEIIGKEICFGEILGKHSDISNIVDEEDITLISQDPEFVRIFEENGGSVGYNPL